MDSRRSAVRTRVVLAIALVLFATLCVVNYARNGTNAWISIVSCSVVASMALAPRLTMALNAALWTLPSRDLDFEATDRDWFMKYRGLSREDATRFVQRGVDLAKVMFVLCASLVQVYFIFTNGHPNPMLVSGAAVATVAFFVILMAGVTVAGLIWAFRART